MQPTLLRFARKERFIAIPDYKRNGKKEALWRVWIWI
jgi:hypothetical protein